jgi:hypothetical protein
MISVDVIGDHIRVLASSSGPRPDCGICVVTNTCAEATVSRRRQGRETRRT